MCDAIGCHEPGLVAFCQWRRIRHRLQFREVRLCKLHADLMDWRPHPGPACDGDWADFDPEAKGEGDD